MKYGLKDGFLGLLLFGLTSLAIAVEIQGTVIETSGLDVTVKVVGENIPVPGDLMEISFSIPGGETLSVGTWKVSSVSGNIVAATVVENTGTPATGQQVVINSNNPVSYKFVPVNNGSSSNKNNQQKAYSAPSENPYVTPENRKVIELLQSSDVTDMRYGAQKAHRNFANDAAVLAVVAEELNKGYAEKPKDGLHVDTMAWLCNVLGASKDVKYRDLLTTVSKKSPSKKIRKYAKKNLGLLR